jgi:hypothetical protein
MSVRAQSDMHQRSHLSRLTSADYAALQHIDLDTGLKNIIHRGLPAST